MESEEKKDPQKKPGQSGEKPSTETVLQPAPSPSVPRIQPTAFNDRETQKSGDENIVEVSDATWEKTVEKAKDPVAVMFYSSTCTFCRQMEPYFRTFANEFRESVVFARLNIMASQWTSERYGVRSTPTFKFFCNGKPVQEMVGAIYPALLKRAIEEVLVHGKECIKNSTLINYEITGYG